MKIHTTSKSSSVIIIALLLGIYVLYLLHYFNILHFTTSSASTPTTFGSPLKGPYESCEDQVCPDITTKKSCLCSNEDTVKNCCAKSCGGNQYCIEACQPIFDPCQ